MRPTCLFNSLALSFALLSGALAQQPPMQQGQPAPPADDRRGNMTDPYRGSNGYGSDNDYPAAEVQAIPGIRAGAVRARLEMDLIQSNLHRWIDRAWDDFLHSKDYLNAADAERKAQDDYTHERQRVLARLADDSNYRTLRGLVDDLHQQIEREHDRPHRLAESEIDSLDHMMALATLKLSYSTALSAMETAALNADNSVQSARTKLVDAASRTRDMRRGFDRGVRRDPEFLAGRARFDEARINHVVSATYLDSAINARDIALDYAYYVHRWDQYRYSTAAYYPSPYYSNGFYSGYTRRY